MMAYQSQKDPRERLQACRRAWQDRAVIPGTLEALLEHVRQGTLLILGLADIDLMTCLPDGRTHISFKADSAWPLLHCKAGAAPSSTSAPAKQPLDAYGKSLPRRFEHNQLTKQHAQSPIHCPFTVANPGSCLPLWAVKGV